MNKCFFIGNLTRDPEPSTTNGGISVCKFCIAVQRSRSSESGEREADFFNVITWRGLADNCSKYLVKGSKVAISGRIENRSYEDKNGDKRYVTEVTADEVEFLSAKSNGASEGQEAAQKGNKKQMSELKQAEDDGLPF